MRYLINIIALILIMTSVSFAQSFINVSAEPEDSFNAVLVEKNGKWLHVLKVAEGRVEVLDSFQVLTGRVDGDKRVQGDEKTPEGVYFVTGFLSPEKLRAMYGEVGKQYGTGAYPLSYPNLKDRLQGKTGGGIWLHGIDPSRNVPVTKGCVAFDNEKLTKMADYIKIGTPVIVTEEGLKGTLDDLRAHFESAKKLVTDYMEAWGNSDFDAFSAAYNPNFKDTAGRSLENYLKYKKNLMDLFPYRKVSADGFRIYTNSDSETVAEFTQFYCAPNVVSYGRKRFYYEQDGESLKISAEEFMPISSESYVREKVHEFLLSWKKSWESLSIDDYMANYSDAFSTRGMNNAGWREDKSGKFAGLENVKVVIDNISFKAYSPVSYAIEFRQKYSGDAYSDTGIKTLRVKGCPGDFKITSEIWRAE
ncbi:L,D-transpeptidase family protein [Deferribacteres bacterium DY0037]|jgi:murein L,D-transpeptidase YafK